MTSFGCLVGHQLNILEKHSITHVLVGYNVVVMTAGEQYYLVEGANC